MFQTIKEVLTTLLPSKPPDNWQICSSEIIVLKLAISINQFPNVLEKSEMKLAEMSLQNSQR